MPEQCPSCGTPVVAGFRFCGTCGALVQPDQESAEPDPVRPSEAEVAELLGLEPVDAVEADASEPTADGRGPDATEDPDRRGSWRRTAAVVLGLLALSAGLIRFGAPTVEQGDRFAASVGTDGNQALDVAIGEFGTGMVWTSVAPMAAPVEPSEPPFGAPALTSDLAIVALPGEVVFAARDGRDGGLVSIAVPTSGRTSPAVVDAEEGEIVVVGAGSAWWLSPRGPSFRSSGGDVADVSPLAVDDLLVVQTRLGNLRAFASPADEVVVRGVDVARSAQDVPSFELSIRAPAEDGFWVAARGRSSTAWSLWRFAGTELSVVEVVDLDGTGIPTIAPSDDGLVVAQDDEVFGLRADGVEVWRLQVGANAEVLGLDGGLVATRFDGGRLTLDAATGRQSARGTVGVVDGPRSEAVADRVIVNTSSGLAVVQVSFSAIVRNFGLGALSVAAQDEVGVAFVAREAGGGVVLRLQPTPESAPTPEGFDLRDVPLVAVSSCRLEALDDRIAWHDGQQLRLLDPEDGTTVREVESTATTASSLAVHDERLHLVDPRGFVRRIDRDLETTDAFPIGSVPVPGVAITEDLIVGGGGVGDLVGIRVEGFLRGLDHDGLSRWLVRTPLALVGPPTAHRDRVAARLLDGSVMLVEDGRAVAQVAPDNGGALEAPLLDDRGAVVRDGRLLVSLFPNGELDWRRAGSPQPPMASDGDLLVAATPSAVAGIDRATGTELWSTNTTSPFGGASTPRAVLLGTDAVLVVLPEALLRLDPATGEVLDRTDLDVALTGDSVLTDRGLVACTSTGQVVLVG